MKLFALIFVSLFSIKLFAVAEKDKTAVIVLSLDGVGYEQLKVIDPGFIEQYGVLPLSPDFPSVTFPGHANLATGVSAQQHEVLTNKPSSREIPFIQSVEEAELYVNRADRMKVPPVWLFAKEQGAEVFVHVWPMSNGKWCGSEIRDNPEEKYETEKAKIYNTVPAIEGKLSSWDKKRDLLIYAYSNAIDHNGHVYGPYSSEVKTQWSEVKTHLEKLKKALNKFNEENKETASLFIVSDHGMYENWLGQAVDVPSYLKENGFDESHEIEIQIRFFKFKTYQPTIEEIRVLIKTFSLKKNDDGSYSFGARGANQALMNGDVNKSCKTQNSNYSYMWNDCKIFAGGRHMYKRGIGSVHYDGIFWTPTNTKLTRSIKRQTDVVPLVADILKIDISKQRDKKSCEILKLDQN